MSDPADAAFTAFHVADRLRAKAQPPWEVYGERTRRFEIHLNGSRTEMIRAPVEVEGFGLRVFQPDDSRWGWASPASTSRSDASVLAALDMAESLARHSSFPARRIDLPGTAGHAASVEVIDREASGPARRRDRSGSPAGCSPRSRADPASRRASARCA